MSGLIEQIADAEAKRLREEKIAKEREDRRLALEPFKTMVTELAPETKDQLRGFREPGHAYILLESIVYHATGENGQWRKGHSITTLNMENRPEQIGRVQYYISKGSRPIHFAKFYKTNDENPARAAKAKMHTGPDHRNPWDHMAAFLKNAMNQKTAASYESEKLGLEKKIQDEIDRNATLTADIQKLKNNKGKNESKQDFIS